MRIFAPAVLGKELADLKVMFWKRSFRRAASPPPGGIDIGIGGRREGCALEAQQGPAEIPMPLQWG